MSREQPAIALVCNTFSASFVFRQTLIAALAAQGRLAGVVSLNDDRAKVSAVAETVPTFVVDRGLGGFFATARALRAQGTGLCHGFTHAGNMAALVLGILLWVPVVMNVTGMGRAFSSTGLKNQMLRVGILCFYGLAQAMIRYVIVQNRDDARLLSRVFLPWWRHKVLHTNGSGIDPDFFQGVAPAAIGTDETQVRVGFFSRALPEKGVLDFYGLAAGYRDRPEIGFFHLGHAGSGDFAPDRITQHAAGQNVDYLSFQVDPRPYLLAMDMVVLPSNYREGFSRLCIEAMLSGKVVIARDTTGVRDHMIPGETGFLYDRAEDLKATFDRALSADRAAIGAAAAAYARDHFDVAQVDQVYFDCYDGTPAPAVAG